MLRFGQLLLIGLTFFVVSTKLYAQPSACFVYLEAGANSLISQRYLAHPGPRGSLGQLSVNDRSNRVLIRDLMSEALAPIFSNMTLLKATGFEQAQVWVKNYEPLITSILASPTSSQSPPAHSFYLMQDAFDKKFPYMMDFLGLWSWQETEDFKFGFDEAEISLFRKLVTSFYFMLSLLNEQGFDLQFSDAFQDAESVFKNHSYSKMDFAYMMDFVFISYLQAITLLNVRPANSKYESMTQHEWLAQLLKPQAGERLSLVEKLALKLRPAFLGPSGLSFAGLNEPLVVKDDKLVFSESLNNLFRVSNQYWELKSTSPEVFDIGLGCPAGVCPHHQSGGTNSVSSIANFSDVLLHMFTLIDQVGLPGTGLYDETEEHVYKQGDSQRDALRVFFEEIDEAAQ